MKLKIHGDEHKDEICLNAEISIHLILLIHTINQGRQNNTGNVNTYCNNGRTQ